MSNPLRFLKRRAEALQSGEPAESNAESVLDPELRDLLSAMSAEELAAIDLDELREFMADEGEGPVADPVFKEQLRRELWWMMVSRLAPPGRTPSS